MIMEFISGGELFDYIGRTVYLTSVLILNQALAYSRYADPFKTCPPPPFTFANLVLY
jgi:hypothetical protein